MDINYWSVRSCSRRGWDRVKVANQYFSSYKFRFIRINNNPVLDLSNIKCIVLSLPVVVISIALHISIKILYFHKRFSLSLQRH